MEEILREMLEECGLTDGTVLTPEIAKKIEDKMNWIVEIISKEHPKYPEYGYYFDMNGKLKEFKRVLT